MTDDAGLMGTAEIAALLGVSRQRVLKLAQRDDFPKPVAVLSMGKVWSGAAVKAWAAQHPRRTSGATAPGGADG